MIIMQTNKSLNNSKLFIFFFTFLVINLGCKKFYKEQIVVKNIAVIGDFFKVPDGLPNTLNRISDYIKKDNDKNKFIDNIIKTQGLPIWNKAKILVKNNGNSVSERSTTTNNDTIVLIPLALSNTEWVNSFLACKVNDSIAINLYSGNNYKQYGYHNIADSMSAEKLAKQIMYLEFESFGHNKFLIRDLNLFKPATGNNNTVRRFYNIKNIQESVNSGSAFSFTFCVQVWVANDEGQIPQGGCPPNDPNCNGGHYEPDCITFQGWSEDFDDLGGSVSWWTPPPPSPSGSIGLSNGTPVGTGGWVSYSFSGAAHLDTWQMTIEDGNKINNWKNNNINADSLDPCQKLILQTLLNTDMGVNTIGRILTKIERAISNENNLEKFKVTYKKSNLGFSGNTNSFFIDPLTGVFSVTIELDSVISQNSTDLYVANSIIHETIHAYMSFLLYKRHLAANNPVLISQFQNITKDSVFSEYVDSLNASEKFRLNLTPLDSYNGNDYDHNYMASKLLGLMGEALGKYASNSLISDEYLWSLAWNGLQNTSIMKRHWINTGNIPVQSTYSLTTNDSTRGLKYALTPQRCENILDIITNEFNSSNSAKGKSRILGGCY
jgi:hypothetical protein